MNDGKVCKCCKQHKQFSEFQPVKRGRFGFHSQCRSCVRPKQNAWRRAKNAEIMAMRPAKLPRQIDPAKKAQALERKNASRRTDDERKKRRDYLARPEVRARVLQLRNARYAAKEKTVAFKADSRLRVLIRRSASSGKNNRSWRDLVDFTIEEFQANFEKQFTKGMSWDEFKAGNIEIDHIVPVANFNITSFDCPEFRACWSLGNLRPMWSADNNAKRAKRMFLL